MLDLKQLEYFVVCTDVGSFSKAAEILYTTQSNISKSIKSLEKTLGFTLFIRHARGISLTFRGKYIYKYASKILEEMRALTEIAENDTEEWLRISFNPSSWFADRFVEFYNLHFHENFYCQIYETSVRKIMERVRDYSDDVGFVYVMENQKEAFQYSLDKNGLEFIPLKRIEAVMYFGKKHPLYTKKNLEDKDFENLRFIQCYQDEFTKNNYWNIQNCNGKELSEMDVSVTTNSDYIMERMLSESQVVNISGSYLTGKKQEIIQGIPMKLKNDKVMFGYLKRKEETLGKWTNEFIVYLKEKLYK